MRKASNSSTLCSSSMEIWERFVSIRDTNVKAGWRINQENVLIGDDGQPLITDFALTKVCYVGLFFIVSMANFHSYSLRVIWSPNLLTSRIVVGGAHRRYSKNKLPCRPRVIYIVLAWRFLRLVQVFLFDNGILNVTYLVVYTRDPVFAYWRKYTCGLQKAGGWTAPPPQRRAYCRAWVGRQHVGTSLSMLVQESRWQAVDWRVCPTV